GGGDVVPTITTVLADAFELVDTNNNGTLSMEEALAEVPGMTQAHFDAIDTDNNGQLSAAELAAQVAAVEGEGEGEGSVSPTIGCPQSKAAFTEGVRKALGDFFLFGLTFVTMLGFRKDR
ncbi:MAG: hypothetical protein L3K26_20005, partial [Candidatus Hydrogenedentes bacterium]|nr:hypothetical protein [Candidatus Hydrogenedentota bacterium]